MEAGETVAIIGTYEKALLGFSISGGKDQEISIRLKFTNQGHIGHVLTVASHSPFVASGGEDETIRLLDIRKGIEHGTLVHHEGSLNKLVFHESASTLFLMCASVDGTISIWKCSQFDCLHALTGHKGEVSGLDVHPSGRFMLSVGVDKTLRTWNLMTGRQAFIKRLGRPSSSVKFSPDGSLFFLAFASSIEIYETASISVKYTISNTESPVTCLIWWGNDRLITGHQDGTLTMYSLDSEETEVKLVASSGSTHKNRVKCMSQTVRNGKSILLSASSDSLLVLWDVKRSKFQELTTAKVPGRPICMTVC